MKALARGYCWWPNIDKSIEDISSNCIECNLRRNNPHKVDTHIWEPSTQPFERVHADYAGPICGIYLLILVDSYTKWPEVRLVHDMTAETTIKACRQIFSQFGIPRYFVTDNGTNFKSHKFQNFLKSNGVISKFTAPYHPATNGQAERYVQTIKKAILKMNCNKSDIENKLQLILFQYRIMPHAETQSSPSQMLFGKQIRSRLDLLLPTNNDNRTQTTINDNKNVIQFNIGTRVECRNYVDSVKWLFGTIKKQIGKLHYLIQLDDGLECRRHIDQIREIGEITPKVHVPRYPDPPTTPKVYTQIMQQEPVVIQDNNPCPPQPPNLDSERETNLYVSGFPNPAPSVSGESAKSRRPQRNLKQPHYLKDYVLPNRKK